MGETLGTVRCVFTSATSSYAQHSDATRSRSNAVPLIAINGIAGAEKPVH